MIYVAGTLVVIVIILVAAAVWLAGSADREVQSTDHNHLGMARLLDQIVNDDMVRPLLSEKQVTTARNLLAAYFPTDKDN